MQSRTRLRCTMSTSLKSEYQQKRPARKGGVFFDCCFDCFITVKKGQKMSKSVCLQDEKSHEKTAKPLRNGGFHW